MLEAVIYTRFSKMKGARSTGEQESESRRWCERHDHPVDRVFTDHISASRFSAKDRPEWRACKDYLRKGHILVVWEASRAHRDLEEFVELRNLCASRNVPFSYNGKVLDLTLGDDRFTAGLDALLAERESEQISLRVLRNRRELAAAGKPAGPPPWGYRRKVDPESGQPITGVWEFDPVEAPRVKEAIRRLLRGDSQRSILNWLAESEGRSFDGPTTLQRCLARPALAGLRVHQGEVIGKGTWKALITEETHKKVIDHIQGQKRAYGHVSPPGPEPKYLLSGIATCGFMLDEVQECGAPLQHKKFSKRSPAYICPEGHVSRAVHLLDQAVEDTILEAATKINPTRFQNDDDDPSAAEALKEEADIEKDLKEYEELAKTRVIGPAEYARISKELRAKLEALRARSAPRRRFSAADFERLQARWPRATLMEKRAAIRAFLTVKVRQRPPAVVTNCEHTDQRAYSRGLCEFCYHRAWRGSIPMPELDGRSDARVEIELA